MSQLRRRDALALGAGIPDHDRACDLTTFYRFTLHCRALFPVFTVVLIAARLVEPMLLLFGVIDVAGAACTGLVLRGEDSG